MRGNQHGAYTLLRRAAGRLMEYGDEHRGVPADRIAQTLVVHADEIEAAERDGRASPEIEFVTITA